jgi:hypothetical protein
MRTYERLLLGTAALSVVLSVALMVALLAVQMYGYEMYYLFGALVS